MIQSMTGYGNTTSGKGSNRFTISIKTVNARFLDIKFKGCDLEPNVEKKIRDIISAKLVRGTVFINFDQNLTSNDEASHFNEERFEMLLSVIDRIDKKYKKRFKKIKNIDSQLEKILIELDRQFLHAKTLGFIHPKTGKFMQFDSDLPNDLQSCIEKWENYVAN